MSDERLIWVDGTPGGVLPLPDRGLDFGDGLFETLLLYRGNPLWLDLHLARLAKGLGVLGFPDCLDTVRDQVAAICSELRASQWAWTALRLTVTRGTGPRGYAPPVGAIPTIVLTATRLERDCSNALAPATLCKADISLGRQPALAGIKHLNRLEQVLASAQAVSSGCDAAVLCDASGRVVSACSGNLFARFDAKILTPALQVAGITGTRRRLVMEQWGPQLGLQVEEGDFTFSDLAVADEVFYTNALIGVRSVASAGELNWSSTEVASALFQQFVSALP